MSLTKQCHIYAIGTDAFYNEGEQFRHKRLLKLYKARKSKECPKWKLQSLNRIIKKEKEELVKLLNSHLEFQEPRVLNEKDLNDKNVVSLFESSLTRSLGLKTNELTKEIMIVNVFFFQVFEDLVKYGYYLNNEKYIFLTASAGQIRQKKAVFVKESSYQEVQLRLMCGLTIYDINQAGGMNTNKFLAYLSLNNSATDVWHNFNIDKSIVVDDFETNVCGTVDYIDDNTYEITRKEMPCPIPHMDGCGIMLDKKTRMVRLPWVKGLLVYFPFDEFIKEKCPGGQAIVKDIYGKEHDILGEGIRYIFTASQFKLHKYYKSWDDYKERFKKYNCEAAYCNIEEDCIPKARINYQMLQTLSDMKDKEIEQITKQSIAEIEDIGQDYQTTMKLLGATCNDKNLNDFQKSLMIYPELFRDAYTRDVLKQTKKSLVKQAKSGRLRVNGKYLFLSPDLFAFSEWLFLKDSNPKGLLKNGEVYCNEFKNDDEVACLRSPHLYKEWAIRVNKRNSELDKWFGDTKCVYTSCHDLISRVLQFDNDGDKSLVIKDKLLTTIAKRNMKDIVPLYYEMKKAQGGALCKNAFYNGMTQAFTSGNIGPKSNLITFVHNNGLQDREQADMVVKWLTMEVNFTIDYAKTLYMPVRPKEVDCIIKKHTRGKAPNFFIYAKDKKKLQVESSNNSTMNRIANYIPSPRIKFNKSIGKFDYHMLLHNQNYLIENNTYIVVAAYDYWVKRQRLLFLEEENRNKNQVNEYINNKIRTSIIESTGYSLDYIVDSLVTYLYTNRGGSTKSLLWNCFGETIFKNIKNNLVGCGRICEICGKRFIPKRSDQVTCGKTCAISLDNQKRSQRRS